MASACLALCIADQTVSHFHYMTHRLVTRTYRNVQLEEKWMLKPVC